MLVSSASLLQLTVCGVPLMLCVQQLTRLELPALQALHIQGLHGEMVALPDTVSIATLVKCLSETVRCALAQAIHSCCRW